jgi:diguanylate cyclase (GGDEF)-like protein
VAERLLSHVRESDIVGRMGGDEFAVILVQADATVAQAKAAALAAAIEGQPVGFGEWAAPLHISWGVAAIAPDLDPEAIVAQADAAMYAAKRRRGVG